MKEIISAISAARELMPDIECRLGEPMRDHTSFRIGAPVRAMFFPKSAEELAKLYEFLRRYDIMPLIFG